MKLSYPIILKPEDGNYNVVFPDVFGLVTFGTTKNEALYMAHDALITAYKSQMLTDTTPSTLTKINTLFPEYEAYMIEIEI